MEQDDVEGRGKSSEGGGNHVNSREKAGCRRFKEGGGGCDHRRRHTAAVNDPVSSTEDDILYNRLGHTLLAYTYETAI